VCSSAVCPKLGLGLGLGLGFNKEAKINRLGLRVLGFNDTY